MIVVCDIDGCIADPCELVKKYLLDGSKWDWTEYYKHTLEILPIPSTILLLRSLVKHSIWTHLYFVTGRPFSDRGATAQWLDNQDLRNNSILYTREAEDNRPTSILKLEKCRLLKPDLVIEDEPEAVNLLKENGFKVLQVHGYRITEKDGTPGIKYDKDTKTK